MQSKNELEENRDGYHEWAVPRGAPVDKPQSYPADIKLQHITQELANSLVLDKKLRLNRMVAQKIFTSFFYKFTNKQLLTN